MVLLDLSGAQSVRFGNTEVLAVRIGNTNVWAAEEPAPVTVSNYAPIPKVDVSHPYTVGSETSPIFWTANYSESIAEEDTTEVYRPGSTSMRLRRTALTSLPTTLAPAVGIGGAWISDFAVGNMWMLEGGQTYTASFMAKTNVTANIRPRVWWSNTGAYTGAAIIVTSAEQPHTDANGWMQHSITFTVPDTGTKYVAMDVRVTVPANTTLNDRAWIQDAVVVPGTSAGTYVDGDMFGYEWGGSENRSRTIVDDSPDIELTTFESSIVSTSPDHYWPFREGTGVSVLDVRQNAGGVITDSADWGPEHVDYPGFGATYNTDGPGDYALLDMDPTLTENDQVTIIWTVKTTETILVDTWASGVPLDRLIPNEPEPGDQLILFEYNGDSALGDDLNRLGCTFGQFFQHMVTGYVDTPTVNWRDDNWHLLVCTMDFANRQVRMWIDGEPQTVSYIDYVALTGGSIDNDAENFTMSDSSFLIGPGHTTDENFVSGTSHVAMYGRELTQTEIDTIWTAFPAKAPEPEPEPEPSTLFSSYNFDETGTQFLDKSGNGRHVTINPTTNRTESFSHDGGHAAKSAAVLAGGSSGVDISVYNSLSSRSITGWVSYYSLAGVWLIRMQISTVDTGAFGLYISGNNLNARVRKNGVNYNATFTGILPVVNTWYHFAQTYDASTGLNSLYLGGILRGTVTVPGGGTPDSANFFDLAADGVNPGDSPNGSATDNLRIHSKALTLEEVVSDMNTPVT